MKTILLIGHGGFYNRGCEAIVKSTCALLKSRFSDLRIVLASFDFKVDEAFNFRLVDSIIPHYSARWTLPWVLTHIMDILKNKDAMLSWYMYPVRKAVENSDIIISIGGDNYCGGEPIYLENIDDYAHKLHKPVILWGATVDTKNLALKTLNDLKTLDAITCRESLTFNGLEQIGIQSTAHLVADPAFTMPCEPVEINTFWPESKFVFGINISPMLNKVRGEKSPKEILNIFTAISRLIIDDYSFGVLLIPHVTKPIPDGHNWNDDYDFMFPLIDKVNRPGMINIMPNSFNAPQTKYVISKCRYFAGARTHSTIAALSSFVPTISIAYSLKAWGISYDIFGSDKYVYDIQMLNEEGLSSSIRQLIENEKEIRHNLADKIPEIINRAYMGAEFLDRFIL